MSTPTATPAPPRSGALRYLLTGLVIGLPIVLVMFRYPAAIAGLVAIAICVATVELTFALLPRSIVPLGDQLVCAGFALIIAGGMLVITLGRPVVAVLWVAFGTVGVLAIPRRNSPFWAQRDNPIATYLRTGFVAGGYPAGWLCGALALFILPAGQHIGQVAVLLIIASDAGAWAIGRSLSGRLFSRAPFPRLSPRKTWEGLIGGFIATVLLGWAFTNYLPRPWMGWALGLGIGLAAPLGDILASSIKRRAGIKDFSRLLKDHGGLMDRCDSASISFAVAYTMAVCAGVL